MNIWEDGTRGNNNAPKYLIDILIVLHCKSYMTRNYTTFLVIAGSIARKFKDLCTEILEYRSKVNRSYVAHLGGILALAEIAADTAYSELKTGLSPLRVRFLLVAASFSFS